MDGRFGASMPAFWEHRSTLTLPPPERFEQWRAWHPSVVLNPLTKAAARGLEAQVLRYRLPDGTQFGCTRSGDVDSEFGRLNPADFFLFGMVIAGGGVARAGRAEIPLETEGRLYLVDGRRPGRIRSSAGFEHLYLVLPREPSLEIVAQDPFSGRQGLLDIPNHGLLGVAIAQLRAVSKHAGELSEPALVAAIRAAAGLVTFGLRQQLGAASEVDRPIAYEMLYLSARRLMEAYCANPELTASSIAIAVGCSRAHLYRAFALQGMSVGDALRDIRLKRAQSQLADSRHRSLGQIARHCGFTDQSSFSRAFRAAFEMTPRQWRRLVRNSASA